MNKPRNRWLLSGGLLLGAGVIIAMLSVGYPPYSSLFRRLGLWLSAGLGGLFSLIPFPLSEPFILLVPLACLVTLIRHGVKHGRSGVKQGLCRVFFVLGLLAFVFQAAYGVHYTAPPMARSVGLEPGGYTARQLGEMTGWLLRQANEWAERVPRDAESTCSFGPFSDLGAEIMAAYEILGAQYPIFDTPRRAPPKEGLLLSGLMSRLDVAGYFFPFTGEGVISANVVDSHAPFTGAHEAAHSMGIGPEDEANFSAFLACTQSSDPRLLYSGYLCAYIYASNALFAADPQLYSSIARDRSPLVDHDLEVHRESLRRFESPVSALGTAVNDTFIKATGQSAGIQSYGKVVDLLIAYYIRMNIEA